MRTLLTFFVLLIFADGSFAKIFQVGPGRTYSSPSKVMGLVANADTVEIDAVTYTGDVGTWHADGLLIRCKNGMAHIDAGGQNAGGKAIWVITGSNTRIENIEFSGATVPDHNGAGIRQEGSGLELRHCYFHDNEDGVLTGANPTSDILFEACEFANNGYGDGYSHNMYIGNVRSFTMRFCYSHHAKIGHCVKSRAMNNIIMYNRIMDEETGTASYLINLPNGGFSVVLGNTMMKGPNARNRTLVDYGSEGLSNPSKQLYVVSNTMVSTRSAGSTFVAVALGAESAKIINNIFGGVGSIFTGSADTVTNAYSSTIHFPFVDFAKYDFRASGDIIFINANASNPGFAGNLSLTPSFEYVQPQDSTIRRALLLVGAFENDFGSVAGNYAKSAVANFPNPFSHNTTIDLADAAQGESFVTIIVSNLLGEILITQKLAPTNSQLVFERGNLDAGAYTYVVTDSRGGLLTFGKFIVD